MIHEHAHNGVRVMVFNATFKNKYFSNYCGCQFYWMEETGVPGENYRPAVCHGQTLSHNAVTSSCDMH
jgi:hypothetical protein